MKHSSRPSLAIEDRLNGPIDIDIDGIVESFVTQRERPPIVRRSTASDISEMLDTDYPSTGRDLGYLLRKLNDVTDRFPRRNSHPGYFGWVGTSGVATDPLAHAIVASLNQNTGGYLMSPVGTTIERSVIGWLKEIAGLPEQAGGVLLSGGSLANLTAIASALASKFGPDYRNKGLHAFCDPSPPVVLCSQAAHFSIRRAAAVLGIGIQQVVVVDVDDQFCMRVDSLIEALDRQRNVVCVVASAGTTNTGAIDPLDEISEQCRMNECWFHVDAAYGGAALMSDKLKSRFRGIEHANSVTLDLHKWFYQSLDCSMLLYRDAKFAHSLFFETSDYLRSSDNQTPEEFMFYHVSPELSRRLRALPVYLSMRHYGIQCLARNVLNNVRCAEYLADLIDQEGELELVVAPQLSILCFRFLKSGLTDDQVDQINSKIRDQVEREGDYLMSPTEVNGRPVLRVCIVNHATRAKHVEGLMRSVLRIGRYVSASGGQ